MQMTPAQNKYCPQGTLVSYKIASKKYTKPDGDISLALSHTEFNTSLVKIQDIPYNLRLFKALKTEI